MLSRLFIYALSLLPCGHLRQIAYCLPQPLVGKKLERPYITQRLERRLGVDEIHVPADRSELRHVLSYCSR